MADKLRVATPDPADESVVRIVTGNLRVLEKTNEFIYKVELSLLDDRTNRNDWRYENLEEHARLFAETPILCAFIGNQVGDGHNFTMRRDENGEEYASFLAPTAERIVGYIPTKADVKVEERDGNKWIVAQGQLWTWYAHELVEKIARQGRMEVSIETLIDKMHMDGSTEVFEKYQILGTTILGDGVAPAVAGAGIKALAEAKDACKELNIKAASYIEKQQPKTKEKTKRKGVERTMSKLALSDIQEKFTDYRVLAASEDGLHIALLDNKGCACAYTFASKEDTAAVIPERIVKVGAKVPITFEDGTEIAVDASEFTSACMEELATAKTSLNAVSGELESVKAEMASMKEFEAKRRVQAAKDAAKRALEAINADRCAEEQIGDEVLDEVNAAADNGDFAECYDADGCWNGDEKACMALKSACMDAVTGMDKAKAAAARKVNALQGIQRNQHEAGGIDALLDRIKG